MNKEQQIAEMAFLGCHRNPQARTNEQLTKINEQLTKIIEKIVNVKCNDNCKIAKAYVKEFAEKLKEKCISCSTECGWLTFCLMEDIDELLKEYME